MENSNALTSKVTECDHQTHFHPTVPLPYATFFACIKPDRPSVKATGFDTHHINSTLNLLFFRYGEILERHGRTISRRRGGGEATKKWTEEGRHM
jgi:hypothetical protein